MTVEPSILIQNATVVTDPLTGEFSNGLCVLVNGPEISAVGSSAELTARHPDALLLDAGGKLLLPGLVDAHTHLYGALIAAMPAPKAKIHRFADVLNHVWWVWDRNLTREYVAASAQAGCAASLKAGITTVFDHHASPQTIEGSLSLLAEQTKRIGMRACLAYEVTDRNGDEGFEAGIAENLRFAAELADGGDAMLRSMFGLHAVFSLSDDSLKRCGAAAAAHDLGCHLHVAEHQFEVERFAESHSKRIPEFLADIGILSPKSVLAHTVNVDAADIEVMKSSGTFNVHNPQSNLSNGVGIAPVLEMLARGQQVCLGSDGFFNLPAQAGLAQMMQATTTGVPGALSHQMAIQMIYGNNVRLAQEIFGCQLGKVKPGYKADLILVRYEPLLPIQSENVFREILQALQTGNVDSAWIDGRLVVNNGVLSRIDETEILENCTKAAENIHERFSSIAEH